METENSEFIDSDVLEEEGIATQVIKFDINDKRIAEAKEEFKDVDAYKDLAGAKQAKTALTKMRTALGEAHKEAKAGALAYGRRCDAEKNRLLEAIGLIEDPIKKAIDDIKNTADRIEQERVDAIMARLEQIQAFALDRHDLTLEQLNNRLDTLLLHQISEDGFQEMLEDAENAKEVAESKLRIAIMNEEARLKEAEEKAELERRNQKLQEELEESRKANEERDRKDREYREEQERVQREADDKRQKELDEQAEELAAAQKKIDDEQAEKDRIAAEEKAAKIAAIQAPDVEKLELYAADIKTLIDNKPTMQVEETNEIMLSAIASLIEVARYIETKAGELK